MKRATTVIAIALASGAIYVFAPGGGIVALVVAAFVTVLVREKKIQEDREALRREKLRAAAWERSYQEEDCR